MQETRGIGPPAVEIGARQVASVVADDDAVGVEHRYYLEDESVPKELGVFVILLQQEVDGSLNHEL